MKSHDAVMAGGVTVVAPVKRGDTVAKIPDADACFIAARDM